MVIKFICIIDLTRSKSSENKPENLISAIENLKSEVVCNAMYGKGQTVLMEPPHIIISSNYTFDQNLLSKDRAEIYKIKN